jgi:hypothetical protein
MGKALWMGAYVNDLANLSASYLVPGGAVIGVELQGPVVQNSNVDV